jgi:hypothetical protein
MKKEEMIIAVKIGEHDNSHSRSFWQEKRASHVAGIVS